MKTNKNTKPFRWKCGHEVFCKSKPALSKYCNTKSKRGFESAAAAARDGLTAHPEHRNAIYVYHKTNGVSGNAVGINFHAR